MEMRLLSKKYFPGPQNILKRHGVGLTKTIAFNFVFFIRQFLEGPFKIFFIVMTLLQ
jgi:hypothetical protein